MGSLAENERLGEKGGRREEFLEICWMGHNEKKKSIAKLPRALLYTSASSLTHTPRHVGDPLTLPQGKKKKE